MHNTNIDLCTLKTCRQVYSSRNTMMIQVYHVYEQLHNAIPERKCKFCMGTYMQEPMPSTSKINQSISFLIEISTSISISASYHIHVHVQNLMH